MLGEVMSYCHNNQIYIREGRRHPLRYTTPGMATSGFSANFRRTTPVCRTGEGWDGRPNVR